MDDRARARNTDPETSHEAAASVDVKTLRGQVLNIFKENNELTDEELVQIAAEKIKHPLSYSGLRTRRKELVERGMVEDSGERRKMASGRRAIVWRYVSDTPQKAPPAPKVRQTIVPVGDTIREVERQLEAIKATAATALTISKLETVTREQWDEVLDGQYKMEGWMRKRVKRLIRLLSEGRIYDDPNEDGRLGPREKK